MKQPYRWIESPCVESRGSCDTPNRTLLVINGQVRTLAHTWKSMFSSLVQPNEPCDIILSIDGQIEEIPDVVIKGLGPRIISILTTRGGKPNGTVEFWLMARAVRMIHSEQYRFLIKTRTDVYHRVPIPLKTLFGETTDFLVSLRMFHKILMNRTGQTNIGVGETLYAWLMTGGMIEFIEHMIVSTPNSPFSKVHPHEWNKHLRATLLELTTSRNLIMKDGNTENDAQILQCLHIILQKYKVVYNIGSTWIQFGYSHHMISSSIEVVEQFGTHTWADVGYNDSDIMRWNQWRHVTESQMRLTYLKMGYNLIDLINLPDFEQSFRPNFTFQQAKLDNTYLFFIVRGYTIERKK